jgi:molybdenum cofactor cytidylyltransferase
MTRKKGVAIILLAAGSSSRMGKSKQLIDIQGETLLKKSVGIALQSKGSNVIVVLGANEAEHRSEIENLPVSIVSNSQWSNGMGSSVKAGLTHLLSQSPIPDAVIIMVCDQPLLTSAHVNNLIDRYDSSGKPIIASSYSNSLGVPALFDQSMFEQLSHLEDAQGAKKIIQIHLDVTDAIDFPAGSIDLDTPEDVKRFNQN